MTDLPKLRRIRWAARGVLVLGLLASTVGNVLHAQPKFVSQAISAWPVLALFLTIELISRVPVSTQRLAVVRVLGTAVIAGIAAWVSYWHMAAVASEYGETNPSPYLLPFSVDGLIVVASICLVELGGQIAAAETEGITDGRRAEDQRQDRVRAGIAPDEPGAQRAGEAGQPRPVREGLLADDGRRTPGGGEEVEGVTDGDQRQGAEAGRADRTAPGQGGERAVGDGESTAGDPTRAAGPAEEVAAERVKLTRPRKRPPNVAGKVARAHSKTPDASHAELARRLDLSPATVKRHRPKTDQINGNVPALVGTSKEE
jgi:hypothetical protein